MGQRHSGSRFVVDLGGLKLPDVVEAHIEAEIEAVVLRVLGGTDLPRSAGRAQRPFIDWIVRQPGQTAGMILEPWPFPGTTEPLGPGDHTLILQAVIDHPFHIIRQLEEQGRGAKPTGTDVLTAALQVEEIDSYVKGRIEVAIDGLRQLDDARHRAPATLDADLADLRSRLRGRPIDEQIQILRSPSADQRQKGGLDEGMAVAAQILEDGRATVYSPETGFNRMLESGAAQPQAREAVDDIKDADAIGATGGGFIGSLVPGIGTAAGAASAGAGASAGAAIAHAIDWLFG